MDHYQNCLNYAPGTKNGPARGVTSFTKAFIEKTWKSLLVWNHKVQSLDIWYVASASGPLPKFLNYAPGAKNGLAPGVTCFT